MYLYVTVQYIVWGHPLWKLSSALLLLSKEGLTTTISSLMSDISTFFHLFHFFHFPYTGTGTMNHTSTIKGWERHRQRQQERVEEKPSYERESSRPPRMFYILQDGHSCAYCPLRLGVEDWHRESVEKIQTIERELNRHSSSLPNLFFLCRPKIASNISLKSDKIAIKNKQNLTLKILNITRFFFS